MACSQSPQVFFALYISSNNPYRCGEVEHVVFDRVQHAEMPPKLHFKDLICTISNLNISKIKYVLCEYILEK